LADSGKQCRIYEQSFTSHHIFYAKTITMQICAALVSPIKSTNLYLLV
jgi:hypothetical protein